MATFYKGDALEMMRQHLQSKSVNLIYFDPPFATTGNWWDEQMDWIAVFDECFRVLRDDGMLVIHCSVPFNYTLIRAAPKPPSYSWYWKKNRVTNFLNVNRQPMRCMEEVLVWTKKRNTYYPQRIGTDVRIVSGRSRKQQRYFLNPVGDTEDQIVVGHAVTHLLDYPVVLDEFSTRPAELVEFIIKSYSAEGDTVLDLTCYKGLSGAVSRRLGRRWIGIDKYHFPAALMQSTHALVSH